MASGYIEYHNNTGIALGTSFNNEVLMTTPSVPNATDAIPLPTSGCRWSHVEIQISSDVNPKTMTVLLTWDSDGNEVIAGPSTEIDLVSNTSNTYIGAFDLGIVPTYPAITTAPSSTNKARGTVYLFLKCDTVSTTVLKIARLHWHNLSKG